MSRIAVLGGTGYLASIIESQIFSKKDKYFFFTRKKKSKNYIDYLNFENNFQILKKFDSIIYLVGSNKDQIKKKKNLINIKNDITRKICDFCKNNNIKLIYISSLQVYKNYGIENISLNSKINLENLYARSHYETERIIFKNLKKNKNIFTILRLGNVFGFNKIISLAKFKNNIVHEFCYSAIKKKRILVKNSSIQRSFIPSQIFIKIINQIIQKNLYNNSIVNISYGIYNLKDITSIIQKRIKIIFDRNVEIKNERYSYKKKTKIYVNHNHKLKFKIKKIYDEIDKILTNIK